jgi:hypothetical protein
MARDRKTVLPPLRGGRSLGGDAPETSPTACYARYGVVYNLRPVRPELVGVVVFHADGIATGADALWNAYGGRRGP